MSSEAPVLEVKGLRVDIPLVGGTLRAVDGVDFLLHRGKTFGIVGESGSGKSMLALAIMGLLPKRARISAEALLLNKQDLLAMSDEQRSREVRGSAMAMIFQEPNTSLNPVYTIGRQMTETMLLHQKTTYAKARERAVFLLERVGLSGAGNRLRQYPHQLSGGQRQRVMIAMGLMNNPELIIADEPTTALDVTIQAQILRLLVDIQKEFGMSMILISHDLGVIARAAQNIAVMYAGRVVESGTARDIFSAASHPYTQGLLHCVPKNEVGKGGRLGFIGGTLPSMREEIPGCSFAPRCPLVREECHRPPLPSREKSPGHVYRCVVESPLCEFVPPRAEAARKNDGDKNDLPLLEMKNVGCYFKVRPSIFSQARTLRAVDGVNLTVKHGEVLALVGESGCGKTTLARMLLGLQEPSAGEVLFCGKRLMDANVEERVRMIQPVFQDPYLSLNPRRTIGEIIGRPLYVARGIGKEGQLSEVRKTMELVGLSKGLLHSYPGQISGGQRQRVALARSLIMSPNLIICDEPTSALDVSVQAQILNLLLDLKDTLGLGYLMITHDLGVVWHMATRVAVMYLGQIVELGEKDEVFGNPRHPYTQALLRSILTPDPDQIIVDNRLGRAFPDPLNPPSGCRFHTRCPEAFDLCRVKAPDFNADGAVAVRCLLYQNKKGEIG